MDNNNYDFYTYGIRIATDMYANGKKIAKEIEKKYGIDARLEFECGLSIELSKQSIKDIENNTISLKKPILGSRIFNGENGSNKSYFDNKVVSKQDTDNNDYNESKVK